MARPGPDPRGEGGESWIYVEDRVSRRKPLMDLPAQRGVLRDEETGSEIPIPWHDQTIAWWKVVKGLAHSTLWTVGDWAFAVSTAYIADSAFSQGGASAFIELRQREAALGMTSEARRKLRIKWVTREELAQLNGESVPVKETTKTPKNVAQIDERRRRSVAG